MREKDSKSLNAGFATMSLPRLCMCSPSSPSAKDRAAKLNGVQRPKIETTRALMGVGVK